MHEEQRKNELENLKQQLEHVKQQDRILAEIEMRLHKMKRIAEYAAGHRLSREESVVLNRQVEEHQAAIWSLEGYLD
ncbi:MULTISPECIES: hypothetical protein [unclassified Sporosarcina]|uniref:hypothetical protein n=1 Tax=unclassified Sporosarcina TaxID=2647733 RepID=UPI00203DD42C|nr:MULTISPECIES: hypothetical protein [unclassified Sporosarcina]GKV64842.1 hypothetical protein NCCP2331_09950 [Sporosarcina sp. NCCP-2331]GLB54952.1 hypothetical protein NCCP2378_07370 [Sporosarcina sp. NCCP-2378]